MVVSLASSLLLLLVVVVIFLLHIWLCIFFLFFLFSHGKVILSVLRTERNLKPCENAI